MMKVSFSVVDTVFGGIKHICNLFYPNVKRSEIMCKLTLGFDYLSVIFTNESQRQPDPTESILSPNSIDFFLVIARRAEVR